MRQDPFYEAVVERFKKKYTKIMEESGREGYPIFV
jgi:hypothetical protein